MNAPALKVPARPPRTATEDAILATLQARLSAPAQGRLATLARDALAALEAHGLPSRRVEEYKYTDLRAALRAFPPLSGAPEAGEEAEAGFKALKVPDAARILFVAGAFARGASDLAGLPEGVSALPLASAAAAGDPLVEYIGSLGPDRHDGALALNTGFLGEGLVVRVASGARPEQAVHIAHAFPSAEALSGFTRTVVVVEEGAEVTLVESFSGRPGVAYLANHAVELVVGDGAKVNLVRLQEESEAATHLGTLVYELGRKAQLEVFTLAQGAALSRYSVFGRFAGQGSTATIRGATLAKGRQHADTTLLIDHAVAHCESRELFKTVLADDARGVF